MNLKIAICDDQPQALETEFLLTTNFLREKHIEGEVIRFSHPDQLLTAAKAEHFQIYILDIVMPMLNGIELSREIRKDDQESQIIFVTNEPGFALQSFSANPINYLLKPVDPKQLYDTLAFALSKINLPEDKAFSIKTSDGLRVLNFNKIACCEYTDHKVICTLTTGESIESRTIIGNFASYITPLLADIRFIQTHASFVVNMNRVECFAKDSFVLYGGKIIPISANKYSFVRDSFMDYLMTRQVPK